MADLESAFRTVYFHNWKEDKEWAFAFSKLAEPTELEVDELVRIAVAGPDQNSDHARVAT